VTLALLTLAVRAIIGSVFMMGMLSVATHHTAEHLLDVVMAGLVIAAVYTARTARGAATPEPGYGGKDD
jgi:hypothetical protein